jgi:hypothetical protein
MYLLVNGQQVKDITCPVQAELCMHRPVVVPSQATGTTRHSMEWAARSPLHLYAIAILHAANMRVSAQRAAQALCVGSVVAGKVRQLYVLTRVGRSCMLH